MYTSQNNPVVRPNESITALKDISLSYQFVIRNEGLFSLGKGCAIACIVLHQCAWGSQSGMKKPITYFAVLW